MYEEQKSLMNKNRWFILLGIFLFSMNITAQDSNISGEWIFQIDNFIYENNWTVTFDQEGSLLSVTMQNEDNRVLEGRGRIFGNEVSWSVRLWRLFGLAVRFRGTVVGRSMTGIFEVGRLSGVWQGTKTVSPNTFGHNAGEDCLLCHVHFQAAGTVFADELASETQPDVSVSLIKTDGNIFVLESTNKDGNIASSYVPDGTYLVRMASMTSRTWHTFPDQKSCNVCHAQVDNSVLAGNKILHKHHTRLPPDNECKHCHHFPAHLSYDSLGTDGVLYSEKQSPIPPGSQVEILGQVFLFNPMEFNIQTKRPDIFAEGFFSMFDVILAVAAKNGVQITYSYDASRKTHFINSLDNKAGDFWYHFSYDAGAGNSNELAYRRAYRWDEALWRPGVWIKVVEGEDLNGLKQEYFEEIQRETNRGHLIPSVRININPSDYKGNPLESHRITVSRDFQDVLVTPHNVRSFGYPSSDPKPFQPGVVTSLDILLSLQDQGKLDLVTSVFYTYFAQKYIHSHYVVAMGFPGVGTAHSSGRQGFVYTTNNGSYNNLPNNADRKFHMTSDICVVHAPDFSYWRWAELGDPYYENLEPNQILLQKTLLEDYEAISRGFNLHQPKFLLDEQLIRISFNCFHPGRVKLCIYNTSGKKLKTLYHRKVRNIGIQNFFWKPLNDKNGVYYMLMEYDGHTQVRTLNIHK